MSRGSKVVAVLDSYTRAPLMRVLRRLWPRLLPAHQRFSRSRQRLSEQYDSDLKLAKHAWDREQARSTYFHELHHIDAEEEGLRTRRLLKSAHRLRVAIPTRFDKEGELTEHWSAGPYGPHDQAYLSVAGVSKVRQAIREEEQWGITKRSHWIQWVAAITGLIRVIIGLVAILSS